LFHFVYLHCHCSSCSSWFCFWNRNIYYFMIRANICVYYTVETFTPVYSVPLFFLLKHIETRMNMFDSKKRNMIWKQKKSKVELRSLNRKISIYFFNDASINIWELKYLALLSKYAVDDQLNPTIDGTSLQLDTSDKTHGVESLCNDIWFGWNEKTNKLVFLFGHHIMQKFPPLTRHPNPPLFIYSMKNYGLTLLPLKKLFNLSIT